MNEETSGNTHRHSTTTGEIHIASRGVHPRWGEEGESHSVDRLRVWEVIRQREEESLFV